MTKAFLAALPALALVACSNEPEPVDTTFEESLSAPVPVDDGPGAVPPNDEAGGLDDVEVDYGEAEGGADAEFASGNPEED